MAAAVLGIGTLGWLLLRGQSLSTQAEGAVTSADIGVARSSLDASPAATAAAAVATTPLDLEEARQRDGRAQPGAPLGEGVAVRVADRVVGQLFAARAAATTLLVMVSDPRAAGTDFAAVADVAAALRKTRDYHIVRLSPAVVEAEGELERAIDAASAQLQHKPLAIVVLAAGNAAPVATSYAAGTTSILALVLISPSGPNEAAGMDDAVWANLQGRQVAIVVGEHDPAAAPTLSAVLRLPLARTIRGASGLRGWALLDQAGRVRSDLAGWLFAITPAAH